MHKTSLQFMYRWLSVIRLMSSRRRNMNRRKSSVLLHLNQEAALTWLLQYLSIPSITSSQLLNYSSRITYSVEKKRQIIGPDLNIKTQTTTALLVKQRTGVPNVSVTLVHPRHCCFVTSRHTHTPESSQLSGSVRHTLSNPLLPSATHSKKVPNPCLSNDPRAKAEARATVKEPSCSEVKQPTKILRQCLTEMPGTRKTVLHFKAVRAKRMWNLVSRRSIITEWE